MLGNSDEMQVGDEIYVVGNPLGELEFSMSTGHVSALNRSVSQVIFAGSEHIYVYDNTGVKLESENYLDFTANMPVALQDLEPDEYSLLCVYRDALYKLTADGGEAYINVTAP